MKFLLVVYIDFEYIPFWDEVIRNEACVSSL